MGIDPSDYLLELARGLGKKNIDYRVGGGTEISAEDVRTLTVGRGEL